MATANMIDKISIKSAEEGQGFDTREIGAQAKNISLVFNSAGEIMPEAGEGDEGVATTTKLSAYLKQQADAKTDSDDEIQAIDDRLKTAEGNITKNTNAIAGNTSNITKNAGDISALQTKIAQAESDIDELQNPIFVVDPVNYGSTLPTTGNVEGRVFFLIES